MGFRQRLSRNGMQDRRFELLNLAKATKSFSRTRESPLMFGKAKSRDSRFRGNDVVPGGLFLPKAAPPSGA
jgi:hypothetical protein